MKSLTPSAFDAEVRRIVAAIRPAHMAAHKRLIQTAEERLIEHSPVLTGQYRASHRANNNSADESYYLPRPSPEYPGMTPLPAPFGFSKAAQESLEFGDITIMSNSVPHAKFVEDGGGPTPAYGVYMSAEVAVNNQALREAANIAKEVIGE